MLRANEIPMEQTLISEHYQLIKLSPTKRLPSRWDQASDALQLDLCDLKDVITTDPAVPDTVRQYMSRLTANYTRPVVLRDSIKRDDVVFFSDYWTRKDSLLTIVDYKKEGSTKDLNAYLGPLSNITTGSYGMAQFELHYKGETLRFWGAVQKEGFTLRKRYWSGAEIYLPIGADDRVDIAVVTQEIRTNYITGAEHTFLLAPRMP